MGGGCTFCSTVCLQFECWRDRREGDGLLRDFGRFCLEYAVVCQSEREEMREK